MTNYTPRQCIIMMVTHYVYTFIYKTKVQKQGCIGSQQDTVDAVIKNIANDMTHRNYIYYYNATYLEYDYLPLFDINTTCMTNITTNNNCIFVG